MDRRAVTVLQKLAAKLAPEAYTQVADALVEEFAVPQPSIATTLRAVSGMPAQINAQTVKAKAPRKPSGRRAAGAAPGSPSRSAQIRALLTKGPMTVADIQAAVPDMPSKQMHPTLAAIGAVPVGTAVDSEGYPRRQYGFPDAASDTGLDAEPVTIQSIPTPEQL